MEAENKVNGIRFQLDFGMIPKIFYRDPADFATRCRRVKGDYLCALVNRYYDMVNPVYFPDSPRQVRPEEFGFSVRKVPGGEILRIVLPPDRDGSLVYCTEYFITCPGGLFSRKKPRLYALERNLGGVMTLGAMEPDGTHTDLCPAGTPEENLAKIAAVMKNG